MPLRSRSLSEGTSDGAQALSKKIHSKTGSFFITLYLASKGLLTVRHTLSYLFNVVICVFFEPQVHIQTELLREAGTSILRQCLPIYLLTYLLGVTLG